MARDVKVPPTCVQYVGCLIYPGSVIVPIIQLVDFTHNFSWREGDETDVLFTPCTVALSNSRTRPFVVSVDDANGGI